MNFGAEYTDIGEAGFWYQDDLHLAAELGKTLLERNRDLESQLKHSHHTQSEQAEELDLLTKQLDVLRNVNESRMRIYEDVDKNLQDLDRANEKLKQENKIDKDKVKKLTEAVDDLEVKCAELSTKLEDLRAVEKQRQKYEHQRTWSSVPSLVDASDQIKEFHGDFDYLGFPSIFKPIGSKSDNIENEQVKKLRDSLRTARLDLAKEQKTREESESKVLQLSKQNTDLTQKVERLEQDQEELAISDQSTYTGDNKMNAVLWRSYSKSAASETSSIADPELLEHDIDELPRGQVVRLKCGGSAYGSRESLNMIGLEADDEFPLESGSDILVSGHLINWKVDDEGIDNDEDTIKPHDPNVSLLGELEVQYRKLVRKYENLIDHKSKNVTPAKIPAEIEKPSASNDVSGGVKMRPKKLGTSRECQTSWRRSLNNLDLRSPPDPIEGHFEKGPPEYRRLFKEIFETLRRSAECEDELDRQNSKTSSTSSPDEVQGGMSGISG